MEADMKVDLKIPGVWTPEVAAKLIGSVEDSTNTQLRVTADGVVFISTTGYGNLNVDGLLFRLETWISGNDYVGQKAAKDQRWVNRIHKVVADNWPKPYSSFIDLF